MAEPNTQRRAMREQIRAHCAVAPASVLYDEPSDALFDVFSARSLALRSAELTEVARRADRVSGAPYLLLVYGDGCQLALTAAGVGFAPDQRHSGPVDLPPVVCWRDFRALLERLQHVLYGHPESQPGKDAVGLVMACLAMLDGARAVGFDVGREEAELERCLAELERRAAPPVVGD